MSTTNLIKNIKGLEEDKVYKEVDIKLKLNRLRSNTGSILFYAFTEMLNNAIDRSKSKKVQIHFSNQSPLVFFIIKDSGIGIFKNIMDKFKLSSEIEALEHVSKGKQTTMPSKHSGEGIFFTSKIADIFKIKSHKLEIIFDNLKNDVFYSEVKNIKGTEVYFQLNPNSKKQLQDLFKKYSNDDFIFDKSKVSVKISQIENPLSRSQAKRLLVGLDKFDRVKFDFKGITLIGQAFADEVFRVFQSRHPHIVLEFENAQPIVQKMIHRAISRTDLK